MKKTKQEITKLANIIKTETDNLPEENAFGEDNTSLIEKSEEIYRDLYLTAGGNEPADVEVSQWVNGDPSDLDDYLG